jgi:dolichol-phosphate mannosyltransferase
MKRILITGACGFVGANLTRRLLPDGHEICILVKPDSDTWRLSGVIRDIDVRFIDLCDATNLRTIVHNFKPDWVFHLAAHGAYAWQANWHQMVATNLVGTINLLECCSETGFESFINTGSSSEYGFKQGAATECDLIEPNSYYAVTKAAATMGCRFLAQSRQLNVTTLRLYSVFGPYEEPNRLIPSLLTAAMRGTLPPLVNPSVARDFVFVDDVVRAYLLAAALVRSESERGAVYNVGTGVQTSLAQIVNLVRTKFEITAEPQWGSMEDRAWDSDTWVASIEKIASDLSWRPEVSLEQGLDCFIEFLLRSRFETH